MKQIIGGPAPQGSSLPQGEGARQLLVDAESGGQRLDNFLLRCLKGVPKTHVYRIIRSGEVRINSARCQAQTRLAAGDRVRLPPIRTAERPAKRPAPVMAPGRALPILFEDDSLLALDKPAALAVHGGSGVSFGVIEILRQMRPESRFLELVHRLDRETSGILLIAKKRSALVHLQDQLRQRSMEKTYLALACGAWPERQKVIDLPLHKYLLPGGERRVRPAAAHEGTAQRAITLVRVLGTVPPRGPVPPLSLLHVGIKTGRTHQIRVHLSSCGCPVAGDDKYGDFALNRALHKQGLKRMFLHAWRLGLVHPASGEPLHLQADLPADLTPILPPALLHCLPLPREPRHAPEPAPQSPAAPL